MLIPIAAIPTDHTTPTGPLRWVVSCNRCGQWGPVARTQLHAIGAAREAGWTCDDRKGVDLCPQHQPTPPPRRPPHATA